MNSKIAKHFKTYARPLGTVRVCNHCGHVEIVKSGTRGTGRGYGMREGNKARGRMIQHIKTHHPDKL